MDEFKEFCKDVFADLNRADQRQAAETYLYGLLNTSGRKSIRQLVAAAPGRSEQSLQQFINQSPWDPEPIRQRLLIHLLRELQPAAWTVEEVHFPKHGHYSAAVERQYVRSLGRVSNCQLAITVTLTVDCYSVPVNWRLLVPDSWGRDTERRARARIPEHELPRPYWQYHLEVLDDMALEWGLPSAPVLVDTTHRGNVDAFLGALDLRRQPYLVQIAPSLGVCYEPTPRQLRAAPAPAYSANGATQFWRGTVNDLFSRTENIPRETIEWRTDEQHGVMRSQFLQLPVRAPAQEHGASSSTMTPRALVADWPLGRPRPRAFWITNLIDRPLSELVALAKLRELAAPRVEEFADRYGLRDHEGRTFAGWHHHVTLASAAYVYHVLSWIRGGNGAKAAPGTDGYPRVDDDISPAASQ